MIPAIIRITPNIFVMVNGSLKTNQAKKVMPSSATEVTIA